MSSRSRRRPRSRDRKASSGTRTINLGWPIVIGVAGVIAVVGLIAFVVIQAGGSSSNFTEEDLAAEADASTALPGEFIDLVEIYGGPYQETAGHVDTPVDYAGAGNSNPPAGGPHWSGACGDDPTTAPAICGPAPWGVYRAEWKPQTLVHNMEHGGAVVWYNTDDQELVSQMEDLVIDMLPDYELVVMAPYSEMEPETVAFTSWSRLDKFPASEFTEERLREFLDAHVRRFNPEHF
jgi:hypothetical protein